MLSRSGVLRKSQGVFGGDSKVCNMFFRLQDIKSNIDYKAASLTRAGRHLYILILLMTKKMP